LDPQNIERCTECGVSLDLCLCANVDLSAHQRLNSVDGQIILMVRGELDAARGQFPESTHMLAALMEEVGELAQALMEHDRDGSQTTQEVLREAVQVAAMAIRVAAEGDENFVYEFPTVEADLPRGPVGGRYD
jgi:NTP pyrophosphatase (non-canonical NTP hydrolase)